MKGKKVVGVVCWNVFNKIGIARKVRLPLLDIPLLDLPLHVSLPWCAVEAQATCIHGDMKSILLMSTCKTNPCKSLQVI